MQRCYTYTFISASILVFLGQAIFLSPDLVGDILPFTHSVYVSVSSFFIFILGVFTSYSIYAGKTGRAKRVSDWIISLTLFILAGIYFYAGLPIEGLIIIVLTISLINTRLQLSRVYPQIVSLIVINIGTAALLLVPMPAYDHIGNYRLPIGILFGVSALVQLLPVFLKKFEKLQYLLELFLSAPWVIWIFLFLDPVRPSQLIPSFFVAAFPVFLRRIPWASIILSPNDFLGRRIIKIINSTQALILLLLGLLLYLLDVAYSAPLATISASITEWRNLALVFATALWVFANHSMMALTITFNEVLFQISGNINRVTNPFLLNPFRQLKYQVEQYVKPLFESQETLKAAYYLNENRLVALSEQLRLEQQRNMQLKWIQELTRQLEGQYDRPVITQLAINVIQRSFDCDLVSVMLYEPEKKEMVTLAVAGKLTHLIPPGYRQNAASGVIGRAARLRKTQIVNDTRLDPDFIALKGQHTLSEVVIPLIYLGILQGVLIVSSEKLEAFNLLDVQTMETIAEEINRAWERGNYQQRLTELIQAGISLSSQMKTENAVEEIASIAKHTLQARFTFVLLLDQDGKFRRTAHAGFAPSLLKSLTKNITEHGLIEAAIHAPDVFRVRDVRKYGNNTRLKLDHKRLQNFLATPIKLRKQNVGAILAFGKQHGLIFTEHDESLAKLLTSQASASIENAWLYQQLGNALQTTTQLHELSIKIIQSESITEAAISIITTAAQISDSGLSGIVIFPAQPEETEICLERYKDASVSYKAARPPLIQQVRDYRQTIIFSKEKDLASIYLPIQTHEKIFGVLWLEIRESAWHNPRLHYSENLQSLTDQAAIALDRTILLANTKQQTKDLSAAYQKLEITYDQTLRSLMAALDARDRETEGHSERVGLIACELGKKIGLTKEQLVTLKRGSLLHDIGKIGIQDMILHKPGPLSPEEWEIMQRHPEIGAKIVENIPFLQDTMTIIRYHQERWNGSGYPLGLKGEEIPLLARIFAVADAFDALTSNRPYRDSITWQEAMNYLYEQSNILFDKGVVVALNKLLDSGEIDAIFSHELH